MIQGIESWKRSVGTITDPPGEVVELGLRSERMSVAVWTYGATLADVVLDHAGRGVHVVAPPPSLAALTARTERRYLGSTMGRYARIVSDGRLPIDGEVHQLLRSAGRHHLHGGPDGFDARHWSGTVSASRAAGTIELGLVSPDGDQGYPGTLTARAAFTLHDDDRLEVAYEAETDAPTLVGLTTHAFWNLAGAGSIDNHTLEVPMRSLLEADAEFVPTGRSLSARGTALDLRRERSLADLELDHCVTLDASGSTVRLRHPPTGRSLELTTDRPCLALYTGDGLDPARCGVCLQPDTYPDAPNRTEFADAILRPGSVYRHRTTFAFSWEDPRRA